MRNAGWQPLHLGVEGMQEGMEVLARAVDALVGFLFVQSRTVAGNLADVGEGVQQSEFGLDEFLVVARQAADEGRRTPRAGCVRGRRSRRNR